MYVDKSQITQKALFENPRRQRGHIAQIKMIRELRGKKLDEIDQRVNCNHPQMVVVVMVAYRWYDQ